MLAIETLGPMDLSVRLPSRISVSGPVPAPRLTVDLERLRAEEQARIDRARQEALARLHELARFD